MDAQEYLDGLRERAVAAGYTLEDSAGDGQVVAYRRDFKLRWGASRMHTVIVASATPEVTGDGLKAFATSALAWGKFVKGQNRGLQSGVAMIAAAVGCTVDATGIEVARRDLVRGYAAFAWPVAVDLTTGTRHHHQGRPKIGALFTGWMREQINTTLPTPADPPRRTDRAHRQAPRRGTSPPSPSAPPGQCLPSVLTCVRTPLQS